MDPFTISTFGELNAEDYDALHNPGSTDETVRFISDLNLSGADILELAIGTGRIALPLTAHGYKVSGIEGSPEMVAKLREKPGGEDIPVVIGDMADAAIDGTFDHAFLVFNTLFNLQSQKEQARCFANTAKRLNPGGSFLIEAFVPDMSGFHDNTRVSARNFSRNSVWLDAVQHDPVRQLLEFQRIRITESGTKLVPLRLRYAWPAEIDLMAQLAGLKLEGRWGGWTREPFSSRSRSHISLYRKEAAI